MSARATSVARPRVGTVPDGMHDIAATFTIESGFGISVGATKVAPRISRA
jgi:hypothetical protein